MSCCKYVPCSSCVSNCTWATMQEKKVFCSSRLQNFLSPSCPLILLLLEISLDIQFWDLSSATKKTTHDDNTHPPNDRREKHKIILSPRSPFLQIYGPIFTWASCCTYKTLTQKTQSRVSDFSPTEIRMASSKTYLMMRFEQIGRRWQLWMWTFPVVWWTFLFPSLLQGNH